MKVIYKGKMGFYDGLTDGRVYEVTEETDTQYKVANDLGAFSTIRKEKFEIASESTLKLLDKYPKYLIKKARQRLGLESEDTSEDELILGYTRNLFFKEITQWEGLMDSYHETIKDWVNEIYGIDLDSISDELELKEKVNI